MIVKYLVLGLLCVAPVLVEAAEEGRLFRFPSTNGCDVVFSYAGDLYRAPLVGGDAALLTSHAGNEIFPRFSPDGKTIAFTGQYDGNTEVFSIPVQGGEPLRLTYTATNLRDDLGDRMGPNNIVMTWTPDGGKVVYRNRISSGFDGRLYTIGVDGGMPEAIELPEGGFCSYSPDGKRLAYNRVMREFRTWKYYKGGMADDIWVYDPDKGCVDNITNNSAQDIIPMWIGDEIFFISDRDRTMNIFSYNTITKQTDKITDFADFDIKFPSCNGKYIVFEKGGYLYSFDAEQRKTSKINITLGSENLYARKEQKNGANYVSYFSLSPSGERLAVTSRGEVFDVAVGKGVTRNLTRSAGEHDRMAAWSADGKSIAYISDKSGETELYLRNVESGIVEQLTKNNNTYISEFKWSPDSRMIEYTDRRNRLKLLDVSSKKVQTLVEDNITAPNDVVFSPDSKWLSYSRVAKNKVSIIYVYNIEHKKEYAITDKWYNSSSPEFSSDGKYLLFTSDRDLEPIYGAKEWNHVYRYSNGIYMALLDKKTPSPFIVADTKAVVDTTSNIMTIDIESVGERIVRLPIGSGSYYNLYCDGERVYYYNRGSTHMFNLSSQKEELIADGAYMDMSTIGKKVILSKENDLYVIDMPKGSVGFGDAVNLNNMNITVDYPLEWRQIFNEAWRVYRDGFYVENMHGVDWNAMRSKYEVLLPYVKSRMDLNYVIGEMIGELNCGHAYVNPGEMPRAGRVNMGLLGAEISRDKSGFFKLEKILQGASWSRDLRSPLTEAGINAKVGEYVVAIDGVPTNESKNMYAMLVGKAGVLTELSLNSKPELKGARRVIITPLENEHPLYHYAWVQNNIRKVDEATDGKVGYIYIPDMGVEGLNEFSRYFYPQLDKEGLIIDDRANGGGNVSPMILERLSREPYRLTMARGVSGVINTVPDAVQVGPKVCLINKYSASDGDLFPWGFRALGLGKLIGTRTWGGVVGISGSMPYMDGTDIRVPFFTSYDPATGDWIIENHGVDPDILIDNDPLREYAGEDEQLNRAIEEVMKEVKDRKPLPSVPTPRVWSK